MAVAVQKSDITKLIGFEVIVNAANGVGVMGAGIAGAIRKAAGRDAATSLEFSRDVRNKAMEKPGGHAAGEVYVTQPGALHRQGVKAIFHAVTMQHPGGPTSYGVVDQCLHTLLNRAIELGYTSIAIPGLGTGIGGLEPTIVAQSTVKIAQKFADKLNILITDIDSEFVEAAQQLL